MSFQNSETSEHEKGSSHPFLDVANNWSSEQNEQQQPPDEEAESNEQRVVTAELGEMTELESMCPACHDNGTTRLIITKIPHFKEVIVSSFECHNCNERNNEVQFGGTFGEGHVQYELSVRSPHDLSRQVVLSEYSSVRIPELDFEIPPKTQPSSLTTVEGLLERIVCGLEQMQPVRRTQAPDLAAKIDDFIKRVESLRSGEIPFTVVIDDPAGNSYIEAVHDYYHPTIDEQLTRIERPRTDIDRQMLGLAVEYNAPRTAAEEAEVDQGVLSDIMQLDSVCPACQRAGIIKMYQCDIPHFKDTIIMAFKCDFCGYKSNEVKSGGAIPEKGLRLTLHVTNESDLRRDVLKSNTASLHVPEIELELVPGTLGGFFTTVEGLLQTIKTQLESLPQATFESGDSALVNEGVGVQNIKEFIAKIDKLCEGNVPFTLILDDPLASIYIQNPRDHLPPPDNEDKQLEIEEYVRSHEQDEELGLHDIVTEGYEVPNETEKPAEAKP